MKVSAKIATFVKPRNVMDNATPSEINYVKGDATNPSSEGNRIIAHICNDVGAWGKGFVVAISKRWKEPESQFKACYKSQQKFGLGEVQFVQVSHDTWIANIIGQKGIRKSAGGLPPIRYDAVRTGLEHVGVFAAKLNASVHMPRIGCGLAGGIWEEIEPLIIKTLSENKVAVTVYDLQ